MLEFILVLSFLPAIAFSQTFPTICVVGSACYQGSWINGITSTFASFQGIRYAQPPIGNLRFKSPQPYYVNEGMIDVSKESKVMCPQMNGPLDDQIYDVVGQEDCLMLNIYVPESVYNDPSLKVPVMTWIHGGGLVSLKLTRLTSLSALV